MRPLVGRTIDPGNKHQEEENEDRAKTLNFIQTKSDSSFVIGSDIKLRILRGEKRTLTCTSSLRDYGIFPFVASFQILLRIYSANGV